MGHTRRGGSVLAVPVHHCFSDYQVGNTEAKPGEEILSVTAIFHH
jgi:hypothetical protein